MGRAEEEPLAVAVRYPCWYDEVIPAFHSKNTGKNK